MNTPDSSGTDSGSLRDTGPTDLDSGPIGSDAGVDSGLTDPDAGRRDAGEAPVDAGAEDAGVDVRDAATLDAGADAGSRVITIDGVIGAAEWAGVPDVTNTVATAWAGNEITRMLATIEVGRLYLAVEGTVEPMNAIVVYFDNDLGGAAGVSSLSDLTDSTGGLDNALSGSFTTPTMFRADYAWGTRDMGRAAVGTDDRIGWRDLASDPGDFAWIDSAVAPTTCSATACEAYIPLAMLGGTAPRTIALFARINNGSGDMSPNQTLPMDDPSRPRDVSMLLTVSD